MNYTEYFRSNSSILLLKLTSKEANNILLNGWSDDIDYVEEFVVLLLNKANRVMGAVSVSKGGLTGTVADPKVIFQVA